MMNRIPFREVQLPKLGTKFVNDFIYSMVMVHETAKSHTEKQNSYIFTLFVHI
jgi:hypothetical protein